MFYITSYRILSNVAYYVKFLPSDSKKLRPSSSPNRNRYAINDTLSEMYNFYVLRTDRIIVLESTKFSVPLKHFRIHKN